MKSLAERKMTSTGRCSKRICSPAVAAVNLRAIQLNIALNAVRGLILHGALLIPQLAAASILDINQNSSVAFSSALYNVPEIFNDQNVKSLAAWDALGRQTHTYVDIAPTQPDGFRFDQDHATAWVDYRQPIAGADATLRAYAKVSGWYLDSGGVNSAHNEIHIHNVVSIENHGSSRALLNFIVSTHGTLLAGGLSNAVTASAQEVTTYNPLGGGCGGIPPFAPYCGILSGAASVYAADATPTAVTVSGDWEGATTLYSKPVAGFVDTLQGIELHSLLGSPSMLMEIGSKWTFEVDFRGIYEVTSGANSGYLSFAEADFSGTGNFIFNATDPLTGLPATGVTITLLSAPVPLPSAIGLMASALIVVTGLARRRTKPTTGLA